jgi:N-acetylmuramoyl-L-alanine amidase
MRYALRPAYIPHPTSIFFHYEHVSDRMKHMKRTALLSSMVFAISLLFVGGCAHGAPPKGPAGLLAAAERCREALYGSNKNMRYRHHWSKCLGLYEAVYVQYPGTDEAARALYQAARMLTRLYPYSGKKEDLDQAIDLCRRLSEGNSTHRLADDAQYLIGEIVSEHKKDLAQAYVEFLKVEVRFPAGDMRPAARKMLDRLALDLDRKEEEKRAAERHDSGSPMVSVMGVRHWSTPTYTRVVIDVDNPTKYTHHLLKPDPDLNTPRRLYVDLEKAKVSAEIDSQVPIGDGLLQRARAGQYTPESVRVVLDTESLGGYKVFHLYDPFRIVVDVKRQEQEQEKPAPPSFAGKTKPVPVRKGIRRAETPESTASLAKQLGLSVRRIVIDPGHGGKDPGCYISGSVEEKDVVLSLAKVVAEKISRTVGCEVHLTRAEDVFLPLERRTAIANMKKADLFISLHINAHRDSAIHGLETYFLNVTTDESAVTVAARENATSERNISDLQKILNDLMLNTKIHESSRLAHEVQKGMLRGVGSRFKQIRDLGVKQAPFYVLIGAEMPAILVETGFITNPAERKRLLTRTYQETLAEGIAAGIKRYIQGIADVYQGG